MAALAASDDPKRRAAVADAVYRRLFSEVGRGVRRSRPRRSCGIGPRGRPQVGGVARRPGSRPCAGEARLAFAGHRRTRGSRTRRCVGVARGRRGRRAASAPSPAAEPLSLRRSGRSAASEAPRRRTPSRALRRKASVGIRRCSPNRRPDAPSRRTHQRVSVAGSGGASAEIDGAPPSMRRSNAARVW
jgi:hypothetical protein